jgi:hypothetical protein
MAGLCSEGSVVARVVIELDVGRAKRRLRCVPGGRCGGMSEGAGAA